MKQSLYNIELEYQQILQSVEEADGELTPEMEESLLINEQQLQGKSIAYLEYIGSREAVNTRIDDEIKRLQAMKKSNSNLVSNLKNRLLDAVKLYGDYEVGLTKFGTRKSSQIIVEDVNELPKEYKVIKITESADKKLLKEAIKSGKEIKGVELREIQNLKIN